MTRNIPDKMQKETLAEMMADSAEAMIVFGMEELGLSYAESKARAKTKSCAGEKIWADLDAKYNTDLRTPRDKDNIDNPDF